MTQAYNLAILANAVDTSGKLNVGTNATGVLPLANGGTGTTNTVNSVVAGSGISVSTSGTQVTVSATGGASGTVTSVATGNGLQGGTITTSGTLSIACPSAHSVGAYALLQNTFGIVTSINGNISGGNLFYQTASNTNTNNNASAPGTWKFMGSCGVFSFPYDREAYSYCRVS